LAGVWDRWEKGDSINAIARDLDRSHSTVQGARARTVGIRPAPKRRSRLALTLAECEEISRGIAVGLSIRAIAAQLNRAPSTVSREINRNGGRRRYRASLTWDRGKEMADHKRFSLAADIQVYFCDPRQPWQRASNENTNGLLRQYFPKGMDISNVHQNRLNAVARQLNERPRETLQFYLPAEKFAECVAAID
jgi:IS30 family transposase